MEDQKKKLLGTGLLAWIVSVEVEKKGPVKKPSEVPGNQMQSHSD